MTKYNSIMLDIESTGLLAEHCNIMQIGAVKFNLETQEVSPSIFNKNLFPLPNRFWEDSTKKFWIKHKEVFKELQKNQVHAKEAIQAFTKWALIDTEDVSLYCKPTHFDQVFIESYYRQCELISPFHYRNCVDINSFLKGICFPDPVPDYEKTSLDLHNAVTDCLLDINRVFDVINGRKDNES